jgi:MFS family permease
MEEVWHSRVNLSTIAVKRIAQKYVAFLRKPDISRLLLVALLSRMPIGMVGFAMLMFLREYLGNFTLAGAAVGINFITMAVAAPVQGRLIDRQGPRPLLKGTGVVQPLARLGMLASAKLGLPFVAVAIFAALAGAFASPITTITRTLWRHLFDREEDRRTAFALDAVMIEINFVMGPAIVAFVLATVGATTAFALAIATVVVSFLVFMASPALRHFKRSEGGERHMLGPLTEPRLLLVFVATFGLTLCFGLLEVGYPAYATALAAPALAGVLLSINSLGSAIGGALFGGLQLETRIERQFAACLALMSIPVFLHAVVGTPLLFGIVAFFAGALIAPSIASQSVLVSRLAPAQYATEAFTWSSTFIVSGLGAGMALGGMLVETVGLRYAFAAGGAVVGCMALLALAIPSPRVAVPAVASD